jgi:hypothetical protein
MPRRADSSSLFVYTPLRSEPLADAAMVESERSIAFALFNGLLPTELTVFYPLLLY